MKLQDFVAETLVEIAAGVRDAQAKVAEFGGSVNRYRSSATAVQNVEFDVEVSTSEATATKSGLGVFVGAVTAGTQGQSDASTRSAGRIRFSIPVELPTQPDPPRA